VMTKASFTIMAPSATVIVTESPLRVSTAPLVKDELGAKPATT
jgi:hypothetical protein